VLGDMYLRLGDEHNAKKYLQAAHDLTTSLAEKKLINDKIEQLAKMKLN
jgi:predicted RNA polymerase sigma factor